MAATLLLADGNPTIQRIVALTFAGQEFTVVSVNDGDEAISSITAQRPDIVLADVSMAKRNGYEVAAYMKERPDLANIPVLLLAGALEPVDQARATEVQCAGVLVKPFEPTQVVARVRELVRGGKGSPTQITPGVPRPIERLIEPRSMPAPPAAQRHEPSPATRAASPSEDIYQEERLRDEPRSKVVKHPSAPVDDPLDDYFDQLDVAFGTVEPPPPSSLATEAQEDETERLDVPTLTSVLGEFGRDPASHGDPSPAFKDDILFAAAPVEPVASPFDVLLAVDDQARAEAKAREQAHAALAASPAMNDAFIEAVAARVVQKLAPDGVTDLVSRVVAAVAERLVHEEIDRIRGRK